MGFFLKRPGLVQVKKRSLKTQWVGLLKEKPDFKKAQWVGLFLSGFFEPGL